jgi:hypothetical protein
VEAFARNHRLPIEWAEKGVRKAFGQLRAHFGRNGVADRLLVEPAHQLMRRLSAGRRYQDFVLGSLNRPDREGVAVFLRGEADLYRRARCYGGGRQRRSGTPPASGNTIKKHAKRDTRLCGCRQL